MESATYTYTKSYAIFQHAKDIIPGGVQASRRPFVSGLSPVYMVKGKGSHCWDVDGNEFIDYTLSLGPVILGYAYQRVNEAVIEALRNGIVFTNNHPIQNELAEKLRQLVPSAEMVTFFKTGSDATSAAVRIAKAHTGKEKVARCGYHGWHDWCCPEVKGVPKILKEYVFAFDGNRPETLESILQQQSDHIACVIIAPERLDSETMEKSLKEIQKLTHECGAILIFDEVKTGFRIALGGVQEHIGIVPDMTTLSKAMANGFPISAVVGKREIMESATETHISSTFNGDFVSMVAALATIRELEERKGVEHIWRMGERLLNGLTDVIEDVGVDAEAKQVPFPPMPFMTFKGEDEKLRAARQLAWTKNTIGRGILYHPSHVWFISLSHSLEDIDRSIESGEQAFKIVKKLL